MMSCWMLWICLIDVNKRQLLVVMCKIWIRKRCGDCLVFCHARVEEIGLLSCPGLQSDYMDPFDDSKVK